MTETKAIQGTGAHERGTGGRPIVIHVSEAFGGGVAAAVRDYVQQSAEFDHILAYTVRAEAPIRPQDLDGFIETHLLKGGHLERIRHLRQLLSNYPDATVHSHSSYGGFYARVARRQSSRSSQVYTPHCYAFERRDMSAARRLAFRTIEWVLSFNTTAFIACSPREATLSYWPGFRGEVTYVPNVFSGRAPERHEAVGLESSQVRIVGSGRLVAQKDPTYFARAVAQLKRMGFNVHAAWIGDGDPEYRAELERAGVRVLGWLSREAVQTVFAQSDFYVHTAAWEGFPLSVLEADRAGLTVIVRRAPWNDGLGFESTLGSPEEIVDLVRKLMSHSERQVAIGRQRLVLAANTPDEQRARLMSTYAKLAGLTPARQTVPPEAMPVSLTRGMR